MGRGAESEHAQLTRFSPLYGTHPRVDQARASQRQRAGLIGRVEQAIAAGKYERALDRLSHLRPVDARDPDLAPLVDEITAGLVEQAREIWAPTFTRLADVCRLRSSMIADTLVYQRHRAVIHIWPQGAEVAGIGSRSEETDRMWAPVRRHRPSVEPCPQRLVREARERQLPRVLSLRPSCG